MPNYTISSSEKTNDDLQKVYNQEKGFFSDCSDDLDTIFQIAIKERSLFPNISGSSDEKTYIHNWIKSYYSAMKSLPSSRTASSKGSCSDPAIKAIVKASRELSKEAADEQEKHHNLFMSAENIQGNLLEEYISSNVRKYGWLWCNGNVLRAIDFCNINGTVLLQIKNKSNTENSSSSAIRSGTSIKKWYRLGTRKVNGNPEPRFMWDELNNIINENKSESERCNMTEKDYQEFLSGVTSKNRNIITDK